jgi:hypothetical protein
MKFIHTGLKYEKYAFMILVINRMGWGLDWIDLAQYRNGWRDLVNTGFVKCGQFLDQLSNYMPFKKDSGWLDS